MREAIRLLGPPDAFLSRQLDILPDRINRETSLPRPFPGAGYAQPSGDRYGERAKTTISVRQVASQDELALLRQPMRRRLLRPLLRTWKRSVKKCFPAWRSP